MGKVNIIQGGACLFHHYKILFTVSKMWYYRVMYGWILLRKIECNIRSHRELLRHTLCNSKTYVSLRFAPCQAERGELTIQEQLSVTLNMEVLL
jgi:hypothetical protein